MLEFEGGDGQSLIVLFLVLAVAKRPSLTTNATRCRGGV